MYQSSWLTSTEVLKSGVPKFHSRYRLGLGQKETPLEPEENVNKTYVQNEFVLSAGMDTDIYLDPSSFIKAAVEKNQQTAEENGWGAERASKLNEVVHAVRVSFMTDEGYKIVKLGETEDTYYGGILDINKDGIYDNDGNKEYLYGEYEGNPSYLPGIDIAPSDDEIESAKNNHNTFLACHQKDVEQVDITSINIKKENALKLDSVTFDFDDPLKPTTPICHVEGGTTKRIVISIYVEGWDKRMTDDIDKASFDINIAFTGIVK